MTSNSIKFLTYATAVLLAVVFVAASFSSSNIKFGTNLLRGRASDAINGSITFSKPGSSTTYFPNYYYYTSGKTNSGMTVYLRNVCDGSFGNSCVAVLPGTTESPSLDPEISFSLTNNSISYSHFEFQNITSIYARCEGDKNRTLYVYTSNNGSTWSSATNFEVTPSGATCSSISGAKYLKIGYQGFYTVNIVEFVINYTCSSVEPVPTKTVDSIEIKTVPTKTEYSSGEYFDPSGLVITATYDDESTEDIEYDSHESDFSFSPSLSTMLTESDENITISYGGKTCNQSISVSGAIASLFGKCTYTNVTAYSTTTVILDFDNNYYYNDASRSNRLYFTYVIEESTITFTLEATRGGYSSCNYSNFSVNYRLFGNTNANGATKTGTISNNYQSITVVINNYTRTFTKA